MSIIGSVHLLKYGDKLSPRQIYLLKKEGNRTFHKTFDLMEEETAADIRNSIRFKVIVTENKDTDIIYCDISNKEFRDLFEKSDYIIREYPMAIENNREDCYLTGGKFSDNDNNLRNEMEELKTIVEQNIKFHIQKIMSFHRGKDKFCDLLSQLGCRMANNSSREMSPNEVRAYMMKVSPFSKEFETVYDNLVQRYAYLIDGLYGCERDRSVSDEYMKKLIQNMGARPRPKLFLDKAENEGARIHSNYILTVKEEGAETKKIKFNSIFSFALYLYLAGNAREELLPIDSMLVDEDTRFEIIAIICSLKGYKASDKNKIITTAQEWLMKLNDALLFRSNYNNLLQKSTVNKEFKKHDYEEFGFVTLGSFGHNLRIGLTFNRKLYEECRDFGEILCRMKNILFELAQVGTLQFDFQHSDNPILLPPL